jgi:hypothetical protein
MRQFGAPAIKPALNAADVSNIVRRAHMPNHHSFIHAAAPSLRARRRAALQATLCAADGDSGRAAPACRQCRFWHF